MILTDYVSPPVDPHFQTQAQRAVGERVALIDELREFEQRVFAAMFVPAYRLRPCRHDALRDNSRYGGGPVSLYLRVGKH